MGLQGLGQAGASDAGALDADEQRRSGRAEPAERRGVAGASCLGLLAAQQPPRSVVDRCGVGVLVGVLASGTCGCSRSALDLL